VTGEKDATTNPPRSRAGEPISVLRPKRPPFGLVQRSRRSHGVGLRDFSIERCIQANQIVDPVVSAPFTANVVRRPLVPKINYEIAVLYPTSEELSQIARDFVIL
jgi:hypothetical protein